MNLQNVVNNVIKGEEISFDLGVQLIKYADKIALYSAANTIREHFCGSKFDLCSITNAKSGYCSEDCKWCSQSKYYATDIEKYPLIEEQRAVQQAQKSAAAGVHRHSLVTSGRSLNNHTFSAIISLYKKIKMNADIGLCASMGLLNSKQLKQLKEVGITHYHCNLETAPTFFPEVCSTHTIQEKIDVIKEAQSLGINVCSGGIIGLGETAEQRVELAITLRDLGITSIPLNILTPIKGTPLQDIAPLSDDDILSTFAVFRFINPKAYIRFAGGRLRIKHVENKALQAGINAALTGDYLTTTGSGIAEDIATFKNQGFVVGE